MNQTTVFGPPGTGKTHHLVTDVLPALLRGGYQPEDITYTAFTRVAADVARERVREVVDADDRDLAGFGTLHSLCGRLLDFNWRDRLLAENGERGRSLLTRFGRESGFQFDFFGEVDDEADLLTPEGKEGNKLLGWWGWARQSGLEGDPLNAAQRFRAMSGAPIPPERFVRFAAEYEEFKADLAMADFTDVLLSADRRGLRPATPVVIVDEAQDLSPLQWRIVDRWRQGARHVFLAGDDDQAIYAFQGADASLLLSRTSQGEVTTLGQSYRLPRASHALASYLSAKIGTRQDKPFAAADREGSVQERTLYRVPFDNGGTWFVLARNTFLLKPVRSFLESRGIPYQSRRGFCPVRTYYPAARAVTALARGRVIARDDLAALVYRLEQGADVDPALRRRVDRSHLHMLPLTVGADDLADLGFSEPWLERLRREPVPVRMLSLPARTRAFLVQLQGERGLDVFNETPRVTLSTIHGVKGDEADHVALLTDMAAASQRTLDSDPDAEHRVWYVGASRARDGLYLISQSTQTAYMPLASGAWRHAWAG